MKIVQLGGAVALSILLAACGQNQNSEVGNSPTLQTSSAPAAAETVYSATGEVTTIEGDQITIAHGPVEGLGWPAMTMGFRAGSPEMANSVTVGDRVSFEFKEASGGYSLTSISKAE